MDLNSLIVPKEITKDELKKTAKKESKKVAVENDKIKHSEAKNGNSVKKYRFPFGMYIDRQLIDVSHIFEEGKEYTESEIAKEMLRHGDYDFAGSVIFDYIEEDNVLVPSFKKHSKG